MASTEGPTRAHGTSTLVGLHDAVAKFAQIDMLGDDLSLTG